MSFVIEIAYARNDGIDSSVTVEKDFQSFHVNTDGSYVLTHSLAWRVNEERAIVELAQRPLSYNRTLETLDVVDAYTQKRDGRKIPVKKDQIRDQQEQQSTGAPMFQDTAVKVIIFPEVGVGDRLVLQYKKYRKTAIFSNQFDDLSAPEFHPTEQFRIIYDMPKGTSLYADERGFIASTPLSKQGRKIYQWDYAQDKMDRIEQDSVAYLDYGKYLVVSTFPNFGAFARAYDASSNLKAHTTPDIVKLANEITGSLTDPHEQAIALNDWIRKNIRYVAVYIGSGGIIPHTAKAVLDNRYGDCKDHVVLLEALLSSKGIESTPALINFGNSYRLPKIPTFNIFNHVITYIPSLNLYLDSTAKSIAGSYLPIQELDKPVVLTKYGTVGHTPSEQSDAVQNVLFFKITSQGMADFTNSSTTMGWAAEPARYAIRNINPIDRELLVQRILSAYGLNGHGTLDPDGSEELLDKYENKISGHIDNFVNLPGPIGVPTLSSFSGGISQAIYVLSMEKERTQSFLCISGDANEQVSFEFSNEINIISFPKPVSMHSKDFDYVSDYVKEGNSISIKRHYNFHHSGEVCNPEEFKRMQPVIEEIKKDLKTQIIVQKY